MPRKTHEVENHPHRGAVVAILIEHGRRCHCIEALLDNGATRSVLPYSAVEVLGLEGTLRRTRGIRGVGGRRLKAWRTKAQLKAQIAILLDSEPKHIGPEVPLDPWFVKPPRRRFGSPPATARPLMGRADFLEFFDYSKADGTFTLEWDELDPPG
jgi:hypothetical protein